LYFFLITEYKFLFWKYKLIYINTLEKF